MSKKKLSIIRTRFAPSPTGDLHLGGARTTLFNYLLAKKFQGQFVLRIEDTDFERNQPKKVEEQYQDLIWLGLKSDESPFDSGSYGPYQQTSRLSIYQEYVQKLLKEKKAYYCFCSKEELEKEKKEFQEREKRMNYQYSRKCLNLTSSQIESLLISQKSYLIRLQIPTGNTYEFIDLVRGKINFQSKDIEDFVIFRNTGIPLMNFAVTIDDYLMKISHVLRGEEHLSNTAKQLVLYQVLDWKPPLFGHLSIILNKQRKKLSKRDKETSDYQMIYQLREKGYLPQAVVNFLLFLGWHPSQATTKEIFSLEEAIDNFDLKGLQSRSAVFSLEKLNWYNNYYIQQLDKEKFTEYAWKVLQKEYQLTEEKKEQIKQISLLFHSQLNYFQELIDLSRYFFQEPLQIDYDLLPQQLEELKEIKKNLTILDSWKQENIRQILQSVEKRLFPLIRRRLTGQKSGPELVEIIYLLGKERILKRLVFTKN